MKAIFKGVIVAQSNKTIVVEGNHYFPADSVMQEYFEKSERVYHCSWKGDANYYNIRIREEFVKDVAWVYHNPKEQAKEIAGYFAFEPAIEVVK